MSVLFLNVLLTLFKVNAGAETLDVTKQDESYNSQQSAPSSRPTWLENRRETVSD